MSTATLPAIIVPVELKVSASTIESLMISALESSSGVAYWCTNARARKPYAVPGKESYPGAQFLGKNLAAGGVLQLFEESDDVKRWHTLSLRSLKKGIALWVVNGHMTRDYLRGLEDDGTLDLTFDAPEADAVIQYAVFGEQRYG